MSADKLKVGEYGYEFTPEDKHFKDGFWLREGEEGTSFFVRFNEINDIEEVITRAIKKAREMINMKENGDNKK